MEFKDYKDLVKLAEAEGFHVTSTTGGKHNVGSLHARGLAIDVRTRDKTDAQCDAFIKLCQSLVLVVRDERARPKGQKVWSGAHIHLNINLNVTPKTAPQELKKGDKGADVAMLQSKLIELGLLGKSEADGDFGEKTETAVKVFQRSKNLRVNGIVGTASKRELFAKQ